MTEEDKKSEDLYSYHATTSSGGTVDLHLHFPNTKSVSKDKGEFALSDALTQAYFYMMKQGYLPMNADFLSPTDLANRYGYTRQYWEKLLKEGKVKYKQTSAGMITTSLWVEGYMKNRKEDVDEYVNNVGKAVATIKTETKRMGTAVCPVCGKTRMNFAVNTNNINALCRACGFHLHVSD